MAVIECPMCKAKARAGGECPVCGVGVARLRLRFKVMGAEKVLERVIACEPEDALLLDEREVEVDNPEELRGRET